MRLFLLGLLIAIAGPAFAQDWLSAPEYDVLLSDRAIEPEMIILRAGEPVRLRFVNNSHRNQDFSARAFFRSAQVRQRDADLVRNGALRVAPLSTRTVALVPKPGRYEVGSRNRLHRALGFKATIVVE